MRDRRRKCGTIGKRWTEDLRMGKVGESGDQMGSGYNDQLYVDKLGNSPGIGLENRNKARDNEDSFIYRREGGYHRENNGSLRIRREDASDQNICYG